MSAEDTVSGTAAGDATLPDVVDAGGGTTIPSAEGNLTVGTLADETRGSAVHDPAATTVEGGVGDYALGDVLLDTYEVLSDPIKGGMGRVYKVRHKGWNIDLACKQPHAELFQTEEQKETFIAECDAWINLGLFQHIVSCYYVRKVDGIPTIFSEWVEGGSLANWMESGKLYEGSEDDQLERILKIAYEYADGLDYAHDAGIIHQDVKPDNVLLTPDCAVKVADFGIARARQGLAKPSALHGKANTMVADGGFYTPAYCSPEQMSGTELTRRTDIWSWAVTVLEMFVGDRPWPNGVVAGTAYEEYLEQARVPVPEQIRKILGQCFNREEGMRPASFLAITAIVGPLLDDLFETEFDERISEHAVETPDALNNRALSYCDLGMSDEAESRWEKALEIEPSHLDSLYNRTLHRWRNGSIGLEEANSTMAYIQGEHKKGDRSKYLLARFYLESGNHEAALDRLSKLRNRKDYPDIPALTAYAQSAPSPGAGTGFDGGLGLSSYYAFSKVVDATVAALDEWDYEQLLAQSKRALDASNPARAMDLLDQAATYHGAKDSGEIITLRQTVGRYCHVRGVKAFKYLRKVKKGSKESSIVVSPHSRYFGLGSEVYKFCGEDDNEQVYSRRPYSLPEDCKVIGWSPDDRFVIAQKTPSSANADPGEGVGKTTICIYSMELKEVGQLWMLTYVCTLQVPLEKPLVKMAQDNNRLLLAGEDKTTGKASITLWDRSLGKPLAFTSPDLTLVDILFAEDDREAIIVSEEKIVTWDFATGGLTDLLAACSEKPGSAINDYSLSSDGRRALVTLCGGEGAGSKDEAGNAVGIYDTGTYECVSLFRGSFRKAQFLPIPRYFVTLGADSTAQLWDCEQGVCLSSMPLKRHSSEVLSVAHSGNYVLTSYRSTCVLRIDYEYELPGSQDWDDGVKPYLDRFARSRPENSAWDTTKRMLRAELGAYGFGWVSEEKAEAYVENAIRTQAEAPKKKKKSWLRALLDDAKDEADRRRGTNGGA